MSFVRLTLAIIISLSAASSAHALTFNPVIDFREAGSWSDANYEKSFTQTQAGFTLTLNATPSPATLWWDDKDGIGIRLSYENDEIESEEILQVVFHESVSLSAIYVADLFEERGYIETGTYRINGGSWVSFDAASLPGTGSNGEHAIYFDQAIMNVTSVDFSAPGKFDGENHEYALLGFDVAGSPIPEPTSALLFGVGMLIAGRRTTRSNR